MEAVSPLLSARLTLHRRRRPPPAALPPRGAAAAERGARAGGAGRSRPLAGRGGAGRP